MIYSVELKSKLQSLGYSDSKILELQSLGVSERVIDAWESLNLACDPEILRAVRESISEVKNGTTPKN